MSDIRHLAERALSASLAFDAYTGNDSTWDRLNVEAFEAKQNFLAALCVETNLDRTMLDLLQSEAVL